MCSTVSMRECPGELCKMFDDGGGGGRGGVLHS